MASTPSAMITPLVGLIDSNADETLAEVLERELPGFWAFLKARHPKFASYGAPDGSPMGYLHAFEVYDAMAETIPAYVRALRNAT